MPGAWASQASRSHGSNSRTTDSILTPKVHHRKRVPSARSGREPSRMRTLRELGYQPGQDSARISHAHTVSAGAAISISLETNTGEPAGSNSTGQRIGIL